MREKGNKKISLKRKILLALIPVVAAGMLISSVLTALLVTSRMKQIVSDNTQDTAAMASERIQEDLLDAFGDFVTLETKLKTEELFEEDGCGMEDGAYVELYNEIFRIYSSNSDILDSIFLGICMLDGSSRSLYYSDHHIRVISLNLDETIGGCSLNSPQARDYVWQLGGTNQVFHQDHSDENRLSLFKVLENKRTNIRCLIYFGFSDDFLQESVFKNMPQGSCQLSFVSDEHCLLWPEGDDAQSPVFEQLEGEYGVVHQVLGGERCLVVYDTIAPAGWKFCVILREAALFSFRESVVQTIFFTFAGTMLLMIAIVGRITRALTKPIERWVQSVRELQSGRFETVLGNTDYYELEQFNKGLYQLTEKVRQLMKKIEEDHQRSRMMEFKLLQEQINPHFLYNTLYCIQELYNMGEVQEGNQMMTCLARFFRKSLSGGKEIIALGEEIALVEDYLHIQKMRNDGLEYEIHVPPKYLSCEMIKFSLQPLVENAIVHGLYGKKDGKVKIAAWQEGAQMILLVQDNGKGFPEEELRELQAALDTGNWEQMKGHFGIRSVHERLRLYYGESAGLWLDEPQEGGVCARLMFPASPKGGAGCFAEL